MAQGTVNIRASMEDSCTTKETTAAQKVTYKQTCNKTCSWERAGSVNRLAPAALGLLLLLGRPQLQLKHMQRLAPLALRLSTA